MRLSHQAATPLLKSILILTLLCSAACPASADLMEFKDFDKELANHGIQLTYSAEGLVDLIELIRNEVELIRTRAAASTGDEQEKLRTVADAVSEVLDNYAKLAATSDNAAKAAAFPALKSLLYSVRGEVLGQQKQHKMRVIFGVLKNLSLKIPYFTPETRALPLELARARMESANLQDPSNGQSYIDPADLAGLSSERVSHLDVRPDNNLWYTEHELQKIKAQYKTAWNALEARMEAYVSAILRRAYRLDQARRILLLDRIQSKATSPKVATHDLYSQSWTLKWGDEVQTESLGNRLYAELGGKYADLVYANKGGLRDLVLVLDGDDPKSAEKSCGTIVTVDQLKACLLASKYKFDVSPYIAGHGLITEDVLRQEPFASASDEKKTLLGRRYVTFNESSVEFASGGNSFLRLGAGPMSLAGARSDRVKRGLAIFTYWIQNKDAKDDNNRGVIDRRTAAYTEYMHDLGASLGSLKISGNPNLLKVGDAFVRRSHKKVTFTANMLYLPKAFDATTYADAVWMTRKIINLPREEIVAAIAATQWPDFQQNVMASRLIARRNAIARVFDVAGPIAFEVSPAVVPLKTPADRLEAVRRFRLSMATQDDEGKAVALLENSMREAGIILENGQSDYEDSVSLWVNDSRVKSGDRVLETMDCKRSVIVSLLERTMHPSGLSRRVQRRSDDKPLRGCQPTRASLGLH
jgi:hypothetical protein